MSDYQGNIIVKNPATPTGPAENGSAPGIWKLSEALAFKRQGIWPTQGVQGADPYFNYVSLLLSTTSLSNANNNLFVDSSGAFNPISRNGNTTQGSVTPYSANWSNYFDGSGDYLQMPSNAAFAFGTGDYTIEGWIYVTVGGLDQRVTWFSDDRHNIDINTSNQIFLYDGAIRTFGTVTVGTWNHFAVSRTSGTVSCYLNGVRGYNASETTNSSTRSMNIAANNAGNGYFNGYISNIRVVKGTGVYSGATITVPTTPLTAISGTSLLTCQSNRFRDASSNNFTITRNGDVRVTDYSPFSPGSPGITYNQSDITNWSGYFNGSTDYLTAPTGSPFQFGTGSFTVEAWIYVNEYQAYDTCIYDNCPVGGSGGRNNAFVWFITSSGTLRTFSQAAFGTASTSTVPLSQWVHVALVRNGSSTATYYINGQSAGTTTIGADVTTGGCVIARLGDANSGYLKGWISNMRILKGVAQYTSNFTPPTSALTAISGTSLLTLQNAAFTDNSTNNLAITPFGQATVTGNSPFNTTGYWSNYFDGSSTFSFSSISLAADFTIEAWVYYTSTSGNPTLLGENPPNNQSLRRLSGKHYFYRQGASITGTIDIPTNQWVHLAVTRSGGTVRIFTNGVLDGSGSISGAFSVNCFGGVDTGTDRLTGYASNVRIVDGTALYTATFTVPTSPLTAVSGTTLLTAQNGTFKDNSTNNRTLTRNGSPTVQSFDPFYTSTIASNGGSMYFDNTGDYLAIPASPSLAFGTGNFTLEAWVYGAGAWSTDPIFESRSSGSSSTGYAFLVNSSGYLNVYTAGGFVGNSSTTLNVGSWNHVALVRSGTGTNQTTYYINGVASGTITLAGNFTDANTNETKIGGSTSAGENWNGYISNARISRLAVYTGNFTPPTTPLTPSANTTLLVNGMNAGIYDATAINDMETIGNAQVTTAVSKFGGSSLYFDGNGDYLSLPGGPQNFYGSGNFTIEGWFYFNSTPSNMPLLGWGNTSYKVIRISTTSINVESDNPSNTSFNVSFNASKTLTTGTWYHIALVRSGNSFTAYVDGVGGTAYTSFTGNVGHASDVMYIGYKSDPTFFNGYIDDLRITNGYARYTTNFTPPTQPFPTF